MKKGFLYVLIVLALIGVGLVIYIFTHEGRLPFEKEKTTSAITEEMKERVKESLDRVYYDGLFANDDFCSLSSVNQYKSYKEKDKEYYRIDKFETYDDLKKYMSSFLSENIVSNITKFTNKNDIAYCYVPAISFPFINDNSLEITSINLDNNNLIVEYKYTTGDGQLYEVKTIEEKALFIKENDVWKIDVLRMN